MRFAGGQVFQRENSSGLTVLNEFEMMCQLRILFPLHFVVFNQTVCHLAAENNVEQVFLQSEQLSELNLDPDALSDMVSIMINKHTYNPSLQDVMDKYYEMFRGKNHPNKTDFFNRTEDSGEEEWVVCERETRVRRSELCVSEEEWVVCERETSLSFIKITQSLIY